MPEVGLNREFLHRACVQFSSVLNELGKTSEAERQYAMRFIRLRAAEHTNEIARALIWRVVDTDDSDPADRAGAWGLLNAALLECGDSSNDLSRTALAGKVLLFLQYLIEHRWYTTLPRRSKEQMDPTSSSSPTTAIASSSSSSRAAAQTRLCVSGFQGKKVVPASILTKDYYGSPLPLPSGSAPPLPTDADAADRCHTSTHGNGWPASTHALPSAHDLADSDPAVTRYRNYYRGILHSWRSVWRSDVYQTLREACRQVEHGGCFLSSAAANYLIIPTTFRDSLWRLRRTTPRPSIALHVLYCYGWPMQTESSSYLSHALAMDATHVDMTGDAQTAAQGANVTDTSQTTMLHHSQSNNHNNNHHHHRHHGASQNHNNLVRPRARILPQSMSEVDALEPTMHPRVRRWLERLIQCEGGCRLCDTWLHREARCPCELPFVKSPSDEAGVRQWQSGTERLPRMREMPYLRAVEVLYQHGLRLPLRVADGLDCLTRLIRAELPYEDCLTAFDVVRGSLTGPRECHALWIHASYNLMPSRTVLDRPHEGCLSPALEKAEMHLTARRRFREWDELLRSVETLDAPFRSRALPLAVVSGLREIRETSSFFLCLVDGSLPASFTPGRYARVPEEVMAVAVWKDVLCHVCLEPYHTSYNCPNKNNDSESNASQHHHDHHDGHSPRKDDAVVDYAYYFVGVNEVAETAQAELWDLQVARLVLEDNSLITMHYPEERARLEDALQRIDQDDRQAKEFRKAELQLAVKLIHERHVPICSECNMAGHSTRRCVRHAARVLHREKLHPVDALLYPHRVTYKLRALQHTAGAAHRPRIMEYRELSDAWELLLHRRGGAYPAGYARAMEELADAGIPLAAARYSTDAVQGFLLAINSGDLLKHLRRLRDGNFPEVCLFCDSCHHGSVGCRLASAEERGFLHELRTWGLTLWAYLKQMDYYDERLPTDWVQGKRSVLALVRRFEEDYAPGGVARGKFMEHNGLDEAVTTAAVVGADGEVATLDSLLPNSRGDVHAHARDAHAAGEGIEAGQPLPSVTEDRDATLMPHKGNKDDAERERRYSKPHVYAMRASAYGSGTFSQLVPPRHTLPDEKEEGVVQEGGDEGGVHEPNGCGPHERRWRGLDRCV